jgi:hypothetical protein
MNHYMAADLHYLEQASVLILSKVMRTIAYSLTKH